MSYPEYSYFLPICSVFVLYLGILLCSGSLERHISLNFRRQIISIMTVMLTSSSIPYYMNISVRYEILPALSDQCLDQ